MIIKTKILFTLLLVLFAFALSAQTVTIGSVIPTASVCSADGSIAVSNVQVANLGGKTVAKVYYSLEAIAPSTFFIGESESSGDKYSYTLLGIPKGLYRVRVKVLFTDMTSVQTTKENVNISGSYTIPAVSAHTYVESLVNCDTTGIMYVRVVGGTKPATVSITAGPSAVGEIGVEKVVNANTSDYYFYSLKSGTYNFQATDNCNSSTTTTATLNVVDLATFEWFGADLNRYTYFTWVDNCNLTINRYFGTNSHVNKTRLQNHYGQHPKITLKIENADLTAGGAYTSTNPIDAVVAIPTQHTINQEFKGTLTVLDPCGRTLASKLATIRLSSLSTSINAITNTYDAYAYALQSGDLTKLSLQIKVRGTGTQLAVDRYEGQQYRVTFNGTTSEWKTITASAGNIDALLFSTGYNNYKDLFDNLTTNPQRAGTLEIKTKCGGVSTSSFSISKPSDDHYAWACGVVSTYFAIDQTSAVVAMPAKVLYTNVVTNKVYTLNIPTWNTSSTVYSMAIPAGTYTKTIVGDDGYADVNVSKAIFQGPQITQDEGSSLYRYTDKNNEMLGRFGISPIKQGMHLKLLSAPDPSYFYDKPITAANFLDFGPNNDAPGVMGDYEFEVTNLCGTKDTIEVKQQNGLEVMSFATAVGANACAGADLVVNGALKKWHLGTPKLIATYYEFLAYPDGFVRPTQNVPVGQNTTLRLKGTYVIGLTSSLTSGSVIRKDTIEYDGSGVEVDMNASFAYVCSGDADSQGKIRVRATNGIGPYTYYLSDKGTGGVNIHLQSYIANNTDGDFFSQSLQKDTEYDITVKDNCGNAAVQTFKVSYLSDFKLAYVENPLVCVGGTIQFRSMALPNPEFTWYKPNGEFWSNSASPSITNAQLSDAGQYKVEVKTSLCGTNIDVFYIDVTVVETPTLSHTEGSRDQTICAGTNIQDIVIQWGGSATDIAITGLVAANYTKDNANKTLTIKGFLSGSYNISTVGGCAVTSLSGTITRKTAPALTTIPTNQYFCTNLTSTLTYSFTNANVVEVTGLPPGLTPLVTTNVKISGTPTTPGIYNVQIRLINSEPLHPCPTKDYLFTIAVGIDLTLTATSATCSSKGKISATIVGGQAPYQYSLDNVIWGTSVVLDNLRAGDYTVYVKDKNACIGSQNVTIPLETGIATGSFSYSDGPLFYGIAQHELQNCIFFGSIDPSEIQNVAQASGDANSALNDNGIIGLVNGQLPKNADGFTDLAKPNFTLDASGKLTLKVKATNFDTKEANMMAWIDFNKNGVYDPNEASTLVKVATGTDNAELLLVWNNAALVNGITYLRLRITSETITNTDAVVAFADGEVEDYRLDLRLFSITKTAMVKSNGGKIANIGDIIWYAIEINNHLLQNIELNVFDVIPHHTIYVDNTANPEAIMYGDTIKWNALDITSGVNQITFEVKVANFPPSGIIHNIAYAEYLKDTINSALHCDLADIIVNPMLANNDCAITWINQSVSINVLHNDIYSDIYLPTIKAQPSKGTAIVNADSTIQYTPNPNVNGLDELQYQLVDLWGNAVVARVQIAVVQPLSKPFVICKNSTKLIAVEPIPGVVFSWYKDIADNFAFATGNSLTVDMKEKDTIFYLSADINGDCQTDKLSVPVYLGVAPIYSDVRIKACKYPERLINLSQFIDTTFISGANWILNWTNVTGPSVNALHQIHTADIVMDGSYTYRYQSESNCGISQANLYFTIGNENQVSTSKTVVMCHKYASDIHLQQILGLDAQGIWSWDPSLDNYIKEAQNAPHQGALLFDGNAAYLDGKGLGITYKTDLNARQIELYYTTTASSCVGAKIYKIVIVLTQDML